MQASDACNDLWRGNYLWFAQGKKAVQKNESDAKKIRDLVAEIKELKTREKNMLRSPAESSTTEIFEALDSINSAVKQRLTRTETKLTQSSSLLAEKETSISCLNVRVAELEDDLVRATNACTNQELRIAHLHKDLCKRSRIIKQLQSENSNLQCDIVDLQYEIETGEKLSSFQEEDGEEVGSLERVESNT